MDPLTAQRIAVMRLQTRLERAAARAFDAACTPAEPPRSGSQTGKRLLFLLGRTHDADHGEVYRLARLAAHVHGRCCDVLHGRLAGLSVPPGTIEEWTQIVEAVEARVDSSPMRRLGHLPGADPQRSRAPTYDTFSDLAEGREVMVNKDT